MSGDRLSPEERAERAEGALREVLGERNRLWAELQRHEALEDDLAFRRRRAGDIERSRWWRAGKPLRLGKRMLTDPSGTLEVIARNLRKGARR